MATVTLSLVSLTGTAQANLAGIKWRWYDEPSLENWTAPTDQGVAESTNGSGQIVIDLVNTVLTSGQAGTLVLESSDGAFKAVYQGMID